MNWAGLSCCIPLFQINLEDVLQHCCVGAAFVSYLHIKTTFSPLDFRVVTCMIDMFVPFDLCKLSLNRFRVSCAHIVQNRNLQLDCFGVVFFSVSCYMKFLFIVLCLWKNLVYSLILVKGGGVFIFTRRSPS